MDYPIKAVLTCFAKICIDKNEIPCFDRKKLINFFYKIDKEYPDIFDTTRFSHDGAGILSEDIEDELFTFGVSRMFQSWGVDFHPHQLSKATLLIYEQDKEKYNKDIQEIAQKFYNELGCDLSGKINEHSKFKHIEDIF